MVLKEKQDILEVMVALQHKELINSVKVLEQERMFLMVIKAQEKLYFN
jgi:hypothetical protein